MKANAERQKQVIMNYPDQTNTIERHKNIPDDINADCVFAINVLYATTDPRSLLEKMDTELSSDGEIVIIDYSWRRNNINQILECAGIDVRQFEQYFIAKLRK